MIQVFKGVAIVESRGGMIAQGLKTSTGSTKKKESTEVRDIKGWEQEEIPHEMMKHQQECGGDQG